MKRYKKSRDRSIKEDNFTLFCADDNIIAKEKSRARDLRDTAWWRKKCSTGICHYCGNKYSPKELTMDHVIPLSRGGSSERFNIVPCCKDCNNKKKNLVPTEWDEYLQMIKYKKSTNE